MVRNFIFILLLPIQLFCKSNPDSLLTVDLQHKNLTKLPVGINISLLQKLHIGNNPIVEIPKELINAKFLKELSINNVNHFNIELSVPTLKKLNLQTLSLNDANLMYIPLELVQIKSLKHLSVANNYIKEIPSYLFLNSDYQSLDLSNNAIKDLPKELELQENLKSLSINNNPCVNEESTYNYLSRIQNLSYLSLKGATSIPSRLWNLKTLQRLDISEGAYTNANLTPDAHKNSLEELKVTDCNELDFTSLTPLLSSQNLKDAILGGEKNVGFNNIIISPNLRSLVMSGKTLEHFSFSNTPSNLTELSLNFNTINCETELINTVTKCHSLKKLNISNCNVSRLPIQIKELKNLETLNISGNKLVSITELLNLKQLQTLDVSLCELTTEQLEKLKKELPNTTIINNDIYKKLPLENVLPKAESFNISPSVTQKITTKEGTEITIPKNSFEYPNGKPVKENVTLNFTPYYSLPEIAASGINMHYESPEISAPFSSAGMFNINAKANGENLQLKKGAEIQVSFKSNDPNESYNYYTYDSIKRNWKQFGKDSITKLKIAKPEDTTKTVENITANNQGFKYPLPTEFYKYQKIKLNWQLNRKNKTTGFFTISSLYEKPDIAFDTTKNVNYFNEIKALSKYTWKVDAQKFSHEIWNLNNKNKIFNYTGETRIFKFLRPRHLSSTTIDKMDVEFDLVADKENDNFILKFYSATDTVCIHAYPNITGKNTDRIQKSTKKMYFNYDAVAKERKKVTSIRKNKFELAYRKYRENLSTTRGMVSQLNSQNNNYIYARRVIADFPPVRRVISLMTLGFINCDRPIIIEKPVDISPIFVTTEGNEIKNGVYQVIDPKYNIVLSYYQPESIKVSKKTILTFLYSSGTSNQVYIGKLNTFDLSNRHGKVKVVLTPLNSQVTESQVAQSINSNN